MVKKKGKSKRTSLKNKYKIKRRVVETHRKSRKQAKRDTKNNVVRHEKKKSDPGIPNSWPFKLELLNEIARARENDERNKKERLEKMKLDCQKQKNQREQHVIGTTNEDDKHHNMDNLIASAESKCIQFDSQSNRHMSEMDTNKSDAKMEHAKSSRRKYLKDFRKVIDASDVLLQVLDARDPIGTRINRTVEDEILCHFDKRMVLLLNKIDLVPKDAIAGWLTTLRKSCPTVAIKCGTEQSLKNNVGRSNGKNAPKSTLGIGVEGLLGLLKNYARTVSTSTSVAASGGKKKVGNKTCITVGIIGYPNVGKSSVINTLKRIRGVSVCSRPGFTTCMQEVILDQHVRLIDSPGVIFDDGQGEMCGSDALLRNCINVDSIDDPISVIQSLLSRCETESLMMTYSIPSFQNGDVMTFLSMVAKRTGHVRKGRLVDEVVVARMVIRDWNAGKVPFYTPPPSVDKIQSSALVNNEHKEESRGDMCSSLIFSGFEDSFDVAMMDENNMHALENKDDMDFVKLKINPEPGTKTEEND